MSFPVAVQSAVFYILACTPCTKVRHRQKATKQAKKEREEKHRIEMEQPHLYRHPDPFNTNPFWQEEIDIGPKLQKKKGANRGANHSQRGLTSAGTHSARSMSTSTATQTSSAAELSALEATQPSVLAQDPAEPVPPMTATSAGVPLMAVQSTPTVTFEDTESVITEDWNHKRYQREDEELWGHDTSGRTGHRLMDAIKHAGTSAGRYMEVKLGMMGERQVTETDRSQFYTPPTNPPVNDYHPPIVRSRPAHRDGYKWMLQPPPPAKVMEGKVPVSRSGSLISVQSRRTTTDSTALGRRVGERAMEARLRKGELQPRPSTARTRSQRTSRSRSVSLSADSDVSEGPSRRRQRASQTPQPVDSDEENPGFRQSSESIVPGHAAQRPRLETILSSGTAGQEPSATTSAESGTSTPLREVQNASPVSATDKRSQRPSGASMDSGLALQV